MMYLKDDRVRATWRFSGMAERDDGLVVSRHDLAAAVPFINENRIAHLEITLGDPLIYVDRAYFEAHQQRVMNGEVQAATDHDVDLTLLRSCPQLVSLVLEGNLLHSEVLAELPALRCLSVDNTLGKGRVDLRPLPLHTLYIQKPGRNVRGFERISSLAELAIWNYQPKSRDLTELTGLTQLSSLKLIQPRIETLSGVELLPRLQQIEVYHARLLKDTSAIDRCTGGIRLFTDPNHAG